MQTNNKKWNSFPFIEINNKIFSVKKRIISIKALPFHFQITNAMIVIYFLQLSDSLLYIIKIMVYLFCNK